VPFCQDRHLIKIADIIPQPNSGQFEERIYDHESPWNSQSWTWIKFTNDDGRVWVGHFRGQPRSVAVSNELRETIVLTSDYVFRLDSDSADIIEFEDQPQYHNLTVAPDGSFILADYYNIERLNTSFKNIESLSSL
jgi:hypothetical protein